MFRPPLPCSAYREQVTDAERGIGNPAFLRLSDIEPEPGVSLCAGKDYSAPRGIEEERLGPAFTNTLS